MPTDTTVNALVINKLTKAQYDEIQNPSPTELYLVPDEIDNVPTSGSDNPVKSGGIYTKLEEKQDTIDSSHKLSADLVDDSSSTNKFTNANEKTTWSGKQAKITASGILKGDGNGGVSAALKQDIVDLGIPGTDTNTTYKLQIGNTTRGDSVNGVDLGSIKNKAAVYNGTDLSLVTTGEKYAWNNKASLDNSGKVPASQLPSYVDDVLEYITTTDFPATGESGKIYVDLKTDRTYRWSGTQYTPIKGDIAIGTITGTAADGGIVNSHITDSTVHVSTAEKQTWNNKVDNTTTVNGHALSGDVSVTASDVGACANNDSRLSDSRVASNMIANYTEVSSNTSGVTTSLTQDGSETKVYYNSGNAAVTVSFATSGLVFTDGSDSMEIPAGGYGEVNFLRVTTGNTTRVFVRSIVSE